MVGTKNSAFKLPNGLKSYLMKGKTFPPLRRCWNSLCSDAVCVVCPLRLFCPLSPSRTFLDRALLICSNLITDQAFELEVGLLLSYLLVLFSDVIYIDIGYLKTF